MTFLLLIFGFILIEMPIVAFLSVVMMFINHFQF